MKMNKLTFKQARDFHLSALRSMGWTISDTTLKVPYATSPDGRYRLWYKAQAVHYTTGFGHSFKDSRAVRQFGLDIRIVGPSQVVGYIM